MHNTFLVRLHAYYQKYSKASQFPGKGQCFYKRLFVHAVTLYISYLMLKERTTHVCIVQVMRIHPLLQLCLIVIRCTVRLPTSKRFPHVHVKGQSLLF